MFKRKMQSVGNSTPTWSDCVTHSKDVTATRKISKTTSCYLLLWPHCCHGNVPHSFHLYARVAAVMCSREGQSWLWCADRMIRHACLTVRRVLSVGLRRFSHVSTGEIIEDEFEWTHLSRQASLYVHVSFDSIHAEIWKHAWFCSVVSLANI